MRIVQGTTDHYVYFVAVDATDLKTRESGTLPGAGSWSVYYSINGGVATAMTTPTINETDSTNMPGVFELLIDEAGMTTLAAGDDTSELVLHITDSGGIMAPVTRVIEIYRQETTAGNTLDVTATGAAGIDWGNIENKGSTVDLSATDINLVDTTTTNTDMRGTDSAALATVCTETRLAELDAGNLPTDIADIPTVAEFNARTLLAASYFDPATDTVANVTTVGTTTTNSDMRGTDNASTHADPTGNAMALTAAAINSIWDELTAEARTAGSYGQLLKDNVDAVLSAIEADTQDIQSRLPAALVSGRIDASVGAVAAAVINSAAFAASAIDAAALATDAGQEIADRVLARNIGGGSDTGRTVTQALRILRNRAAIAAGTLTVYEEDDSTSSWTAAVTTAAGNPISEVNPA
jgi:hypothetical protein